MLGLLAATLEVHHRNCCQFVVVSSESRDQGIVALVVGAAAATLGLQCI